MGSLISLIEDSMLQRSLLGNIRYWKHKKNYLWFGDKCYHMIDHGFNHILDDWNIANSILFPILKYEIREQDYRFGDLCISKDELLYAFSMAIWLHDIGHKGNHRYGEPHLIRETHGIISGELILSKPDSFGIMIKREKEIEIYRELLFPAGKEKKPVTQLILEQVERKKSITILEMIALFTIYHKSNSPLREREYYEMVQKNKFIPRDFFFNCNPNNGVITLESILDKLPSSSFKEDFFSLVALFRFIDGLDIKVTRVGDPNERELKLWVIQRDLEYNFRRLEVLAERMADKVAENQFHRELFIKNFYLDVKEKVEKKESLIVNELARRLKNFEEWG